MRHWLNNTYLLVIIYQEIIVSHLVVVNILYKDGIVWRTLSNRSNRKTGVPIPNSMGRRCIGKRCRTNDRIAYIRMYLWFITSHCYCYHIRFVSSINLVFKSTHRYLIPNNFRKFRRVINLRGYRSSEHTHLTCLKIYGIDFRSKGLNRSITPIDLIFQQSEDLLKYSQGKAPRALFLSAHPRERGIFYE